MAIRGRRVSFGEYFRGDKIILDVPFRDGRYADYSKNQYTWTLYNAVDGKAHPWSKQGGRYFDGSGDYLNTGSGVDIIPAATDFTFFVNVAYDVWPPTGNRIFQQRVNNKAYIDLYRNSGWWVFGSWNGSAYDYTTGYGYSREGQYMWNQLAFSYNHASTTKVIYINGKRAGLTSASIANQAFAYTMTLIGRETGGSANYYHKGWLQDLGAILRTVSMNEVQDYFKRSTFFDRKPIWSFPYMTPAGGGGGIPLMQPTYYRRRVA